MLTTANAVGYIWSGHFNPAVIIGLWARQRFPPKDILLYVIAQLIGAVIAAGVIYAMASGKTDFALGATGLPGNGYGAHSPDGYSLNAALITEIVLTFGFLMIILGSTHGRAPVAFAPIAIGLALTLIHLISIPITNTSVNPARSTDPALLAGGLALQQLWLFWAARIVGALVAGFTWRGLGIVQEPDVTGSDRPH